MTTDEIKQIKNALKVNANDIEVILEIIKILDEKTCEISLELLLSLSKSEEWAIKDSAINSLLNRRKKSIDYIENLKNKDEETRRILKYLQQTLTPPNLRYL